MLRIARLKAVGTKKRSDGEVTAGRRHVPDPRLAGDGEAVEPIGVDHPLLGKILHELRGPLQSVLVSLAVAKRTGGPVEQSHAVTVAERQALRAMVLLDEFVAGVREGRTTFSIRPVVLDLRPVIADAVENAAVLAREAGLSLAVAMPKHRLLVLGDAERFRQVLSNILANAIRLTPRGGSVSVGAELDDAAVAIWVRDSGAGIETQDLRRIFLPRFGGTHEHGLGLGLTIAREIVEAHGGTIEARSAGAGTGAEFRITCPRVRGRRRSVRPRP